jgi:hypothetical protein
MNLNRSSHDVIDEFGGGSLNGCDVLTHPLVVLVAINLPSSPQNQEAELLEFGPGIGDVALHVLFIGKEGSLGRATEGAFAHHVERTLADPN